MEPRAPEAASLIKNQHETRNKNDKRKEISRKTHYY